MRVNARQYELAPGIVARYKLRPKKRNPKSSSVYRHFLRAIKSGEHIETLPLMCGTLLVNMRDATIWLGTDGGLGIERYHPRTTEIIHTEDYAIHSYVAKVAELERPTLYGAVDRKEIKSCNLALGTTLVHVEDARRWRDTFHGKQFRAHGLSKTLEGWSRWTCRRVSAIELLERIKKGMSMADAIEDAEKKRATR